MLTREGKYGEILSAVIHLEKAEFEEINWRYLLEHEITPELMNEVHQESISWYRSTGV